MADISYSNSLHILGHHTLTSENECTWDFLWNWLGDREVFFCKDNNDVLSNSQYKMLECFRILHYVDGLVFWQLNSNPVKIRYVRESFRILRRQCTQPLVVYIYVRKTFLVAIKSRKIISFRKFIVGLLI